jgi:homoserine kinase
MIIRVPASSANIGPGFDALGMALSLYAEVAAVGDGDDPPDAGHVVESTHPAAVAFARAGGQGRLWVRSPIPSGRGLGFSGAVRVGGIVAALLQHCAGDVERVWAQRPAMVKLAAELEGHADNVAASMYGGVIATAGERVVSVPLRLDPAIVVWIPTFTTSTDQSRTALAGAVPFADAVFNVGRTALLVAALAAGDVDVLRDATADRLHQPLRFSGAEPSRAACESALTAGAWCAWLSGSGPTVAAMCAVDDADALAAQMPGEGHCKVLRIDHAGVTIE